MRDCGLYNNQGKKGYTAFLGVIICLAFCLGHPVMAKEKSQNADVQAPKVKAPKIDGRLNDKVWAQIALNKTGLMSGWVDNKGRLIKQQRMAFVAYDDKYLFIAMKAYTPDIFKLKAGKSGMAYVGDCLEVHIKAPNGNYYQWAIDVEGNLGAGRVPAGTRTHELRGQSRFGLNNWTVELAIPWSVVGISPESGLKFGFNLVANNAYQGRDRWKVVAWKLPFWVRENQNTLQLQ